MFIFQHLDNCATTMYYVWPSE